VGFEFPPQLNFKKGLDTIKKKSIITPMNTFNLLSELSYLSESLDSAHLCEEKSI